MSALSVTILGCSGSYAGPGGACSGYLISSDEASVWLDTGPGTLGPLQTHVGIADLSAVVLTHAHPDHWLDLPVIASALEYFFDRDRLPVYSNAVTRERADRIFGDPTQIERVFDWQVVDETSQIAIGDQMWTFRSTHHYVPTVAARSAVGDASIVYSADTSPAWSPTSFGAPVSLFLCESSFAERTGNEGIEHLSGAEAGLLATDVNAGRLVLTHLTPGEDPEACLRQAATTYSGPMDVAEPGATYHA